MHFNKELFAKAAIASDNGTHSSIPRCIPQACSLRLSVFHSRELRCKDTYHEEGECPWEEVIAAPPQRNSALRGLGYVH